MFTMRAVWIGLLFLASCASPPPAPPVLERGLVASPEPLASEIGARILREGGNAVDAAIAIQFALAVTFPNAGNLGGGGFMLVHTASGEIAIDYREKAPAAATRDMFLDEHKQVVPKLSLSTGLASGVPGTVAGMGLAHARYGSLPWPSLLAPAIALADRGWRLDAWTARSFANDRRNDLPDYFKGNAGEIFLQPELAATLKAIASSGPDGFYHGPVARKIVETMARTGGLICHEDLGTYRAELRVPVEGSYRGTRVVSMSPPSSGGVALLQMLNMAEPHDVRALGFQSPSHVHLVAEIEKRVFADRAEHLGDPDFVRVPASRLVEKGYAMDRMKDFSASRRSDPAAITHGRMPGEGDHTTHFSVVDKWGNAVSNTTTLNDSYGSGIVVRGAGFLLNNEMDDFSAKPGAPNLFGVTGALANSIAPAKRMLSSMCPTFVFRDGRLWLVLGTPGGPTIFTTVFQVIANRVDFGRTLDEAVLAPRFHHQWPPLGRDADPIFVEKGFPAQTVSALEHLGYSFQPRGRIGDVQAIEVAGGKALGASDPRGIGRVAFE
jgi:gamma-glutamyltranspeptidase/glutathione hydrolase